MAYNGYYGLIAYNETVCLRKRKLLLPTTESIQFTKLHYTFLGVISFSFFLNDQFLSNLVNDIFITFSITTIVLINIRIRIRRCNSTYISISRKSDFSLVVTTFSLLFRSLRNKFPIFLFDIVTN